MLSKTETTILKLLFQDLTKEYIIRELSLSLNLPYPQIHRSTQSLIKKKLVKVKQIGKSKIINLILEKTNYDYITIEINRKQELLKRNKTIKILDEDLEKVHYSHFICVLFGSYAIGKEKKNSDIDLLFVIPEDYDYNKFERTIKSTITLNNVDINITTEKGLLEMWKSPLKLTVGNEILKKHVVLYGMEQFLRLRKRYYVGL